MHTWSSPGAASQAEVLIAGQGGISVGCVAEAAGHVAKFADEACRAPRIVPGDVITHRPQVGLCLAGKLDPHDSPRASAIAI